jgi:hypothetical protein
MKWFIPSWNGDLRLEPDPDDSQVTLLSIVKPTVSETRIVNEMGKTFGEKGWLKEPWKEIETSRFKTKTFKVNAPLEEVGVVATPIMRPGKQVLTAIRFVDGKVETVNGQEPEKLKALAEKAKDTGKAAATVKRPTPSCPSCIPGSIEPATEVLLAFLNKEEHESWAKERCIVVQGGISGNQYLLSHRHSPFARRAGRMCFDLDDRFVVHFHDWSVPPEEEVLAAKLILEHREDWLRNEATCLGAPRAKMVFKNPFGDYFDGVPDAQLSQGIGTLLKGLLPS